MASRYPEYRRSEIIRKYMTEPYKTIIPQSKYNSIIREIEKSKIRVSFFMFIYSESELHHIYTYYVWLHTFQAKVKGVLITIIIYLINIVQLYIIIYFQAIIIKRSFLFRRYTFLENTRAPLCDSYKLVAHRARSR